MEFKSLKDNYFSKYENFFQIINNSLVINNKKYLITDIIYDEITNKELIEQGLNYKNIIVSPVYKNTITFWLIKKKKDKEYFKKYNWVMTENENKEQNLFIYNRETKKNIILRGKITSDYLQTNKIDEIKYYIITFKIYTKK